MAFRIAGAEHIEVGLAVVDVGREVAGVVEAADRLLAVDVVAAQREHGGDAAASNMSSASSIFASSEYRAVRCATAGMRIPRDRVGDARGGGAVRMRAVPVGDRDEVGVQAFESVKRVVDGPDGASRLGGNTSSEKIGECM